MGRLCGDLIVRAHLQFEKYGLSRSCSLIFFKTLIFALLHVKSAILVAFYYAFKANYPRSIWSHFSGINFCVYEKHVLYSRVYRSKSKNLLIFNTTELYKSKVRKSNVRFSSIVHFFCDFDLVRLPNSIELNPRIEFDWVRLSSIEFDWNSVWLGSICYAGTDTSLFWPQSLTNYFIVKMSTTVFMLKLLTWVTFLWLLEYISWMYMSLRNHSESYKNRKTFYLTWENEQYKTWLKVYVKHKRNVLYSVLTVLIDYMTHIVLLSGTIQNSV